MVVYDSQAGGGVFFDANAHMVEGYDDIVAALGVLSDRSMEFRGATFGEPEHFIQDGPQRIYKAVVNKAFIPYGTKDNAGRYVRDERYELPLSDLLDSN